ncbi:MAG: hypothetical protein ACT4OO_03745 [Nitrospiraceae bacterium]
MMALQLLFIMLLFANCSKIPFNPESVVPTKTPLPYSVNVKVTALDSFLVEPGSVMVADPNLQNHILVQTPSLGSKKEEWEKAILDYLGTRQTFRRVGLSGASDWNLAMRIIVYIDPSVQYKFNHIYVARTETIVQDPRNGRPLITYSGFGKAVGEVSRGGKEDDAAPINRAVHAALNDVFGKMESDYKRLAAL